MPIPDKFRDKPTVKSGLELYWKAFQDLSSDRDIGMGIGPIPWSSIHTWGSRNHIVGDDFERLVLMIRGLDAVYMDKQATKSKGKIGKTKSFTKPKAMRST